MTGRPRTPALLRFWPKVRKTETCWLWTASVGPSGYGRFYDGEAAVKAHRYGFALANGPIPPGLLVLHDCDTPSCVNPSHLRLGTHLDNMADMRERQRQTRGADVCSNVLTPESVVAIREEYARGGISQTALARRHGVTSNNVCCIVRGKTWKHIGGPRVSVGRGRRTADA